MRYGSRFNPEDVVRHLPDRDASHMDSRWASSGVSIRTSTLQEHNDRRAEQTSRKVWRACSSCRWTCRFSEKFSVNQTRHRRADHATLAKQKNSERKTLSSTSEKQHMSWTRVRIGGGSREMDHEDTKRLSNSSVARRSPNIGSNIENTPRG